MKSQFKLLFPLLVVFTLSQPALAEQSKLAHMKIYQQQGIDKVDPDNGQRLWKSTVNERSCTNCHGDDLTKIGKHAKTGKIIQPMALSVNGDRYQDGRKIEKWFLRNCKWTFSRQCSAQEKADILSWLSSQ
jgi:hypothetical protein